jgi:hypothetical protein
MAKKEVKKTVITLDAANVPGCGMVPFVKDVLFSGPLTARAFGRIMRVGYDLDENNPQPVLYNTNVTSCHTNFEMFQGLVSSILTSAHAMLMLGDADGNPVEFVATPEFGNLVKARQEEIKADVDEEVASVDSSVAEVDCVLDATADDEPASEEEDNEEAETVPFETKEAAEEVDDTDEGEEGDFEYEDDEESDAAEDSEVEGDADEEGVDFSELDIDSYALEDLVVIADELGVVYSSKTNEKQLRKKIKEAIEQSA